VLRFDDVSFAYQPGKPVLQGLSFTVPERSMTAIVGPSGSGKSTILNLILRFWDVTSGRVTIGGADVTRIGESGLSDLVTMVFQEVYQFAGTIRDNIVPGRPDAPQAAIEQAARDAPAHDFILALPEGYDTPVGEGGATLSGGERQRIAIARAIFKDAPVVLPDEATAAIDPTNERALQTALARLVAGRSLIVVAHKLATIQAADQILVLDKGRITERGNHAELLAREGLYARLWSHRARAAGWKIAVTRKPGTGFRRQSVARQTHASQQPAPRPPATGYPATAALEIGLDAVTIKAVAAHLGLDHSSLYRHVRSRDEIAAAAGLAVAELDWRSPDPAARTTGGANAAA